MISFAGIVVSITGLAFLFDIIRRRWSIDLAFLATAAVAVNPVVVTNAGSVTSETLFTTLTLGSLWAANRSERARASRAPGVRAGVLAGALAIASALTRSAGVTLPVALGVHWLYRRRYRWVFVLAAATTVTVRVARLDARRAGAAGAPILCGRRGERARGRRLAREHDGSPAQAKRIDLCRAVDPDGAVAARDAAHATGQRRLGRRAAGRCRPSGSFQRGDAGTRSCGIWAPTRGCSSSGHTVWSGFSIHCCLCSSR